MPRLILTLFATLILTTAVAAPATAANRDRIIEDCADDGRLQGNYSASELREARQNLPSDVAEYTDCADVLRRGELPDRGPAGSGGSGMSGSGGGGGGVGAASGAGGGELLTPSTPEETQKLADVAAGQAEPVEINGQSVVPGASGLAPNATRNGVPGTLLAVLILLAAAGLLAFAPAVRHSAPWQRLLRRG